MWLPRKQLQTGKACWAPGLAGVGIPALGNKSNTHALVNLTINTAFLSIITYTSQKLSLHILGCKLNYELTEL